MSRWNVGHRVIIKGFANLDLFGVIWTCTFLTVLFLFYVIKFWALVTVRLPTKSFLLTFWNILGLVCLLSYYAAVIYFPIVWMIKLKLGLACSFALPMENVSTFSAYNQRQTILPKFSTYLYFLFAPTLIYKESYPRSKNKSDWKYIAVCVAEFYAALFMLGYVFEIGFIPHLEEFGIKPFAVGDVLLLSLQCFPYGMATVLIIFYMGLHLWLNVFAELLRFSDRLFYKDWWTSKSFGEYYRKWNVVVHDWLYTYIYKDFYDNVIPSKLLAKCLVFLVSGIFHEYVFAFAFGFFLPIVFVQIFITVFIMEMLKLLNMDFANSFMWFSLCFGISLNSTIYFIEYYARLNCPISSLQSSKYDFFIPRFLSCYK
ncbi:hypothetical protein FQR65_LT06400 [Abscondita terminalis]|nr:hypothetical protein FQR65_LT06400 [Abscondita terminalis]